VKHPLRCVQHIVLYSVSLVYSIVQQWILKYRPNHTRMTFGHIAADFERLLQDVRQVLGCFFAFILDL